MFRDPTWFKISTFSLAVFFIALSDALISFWAPNILQDTLGSPILMGIVISFQSVIGLVADLVFPKLLKFTRVRRLIILSIITCFLTMLMLFASTMRPMIILFLIAMATWGTYYELIGFAQYQFVADSVPAPIRSGAWGIIGIFRNLSYFLGPLLAAALLLRGNITLAIVIILFLVIAYLIISATKKSHEKAIELTVDKMNVFEELGHWLTLSRRVWPIIIVSFLMGAIDATFWTTGAVMTEKMAHVNPLGSLFLPLYAAPSLVTGFFIAKLGIAKGKKKLAEIFLLLAGIPLMVIGISSNPTDGDWN
jgi:MFS family permease